MFYNERATSSAALDFGFSYRRYVKSEKTDVADHRAQLRKINALGIKQANKCMNMAAMAHNLKKYLKFMERHAKSGARAICALKTFQKERCQLFLALVNRPKFDLQTTWPKTKSPLKGLKNVHFGTDQRLVQRLLMLATVFF